MSPHPVVEYCKVLADLSHRFLARTLFSVLNQLSLECAEEAFHLCIVVTVPTISRFLRSLMAARYRFPWERTMKRLISHPPGAGQGPRNDNDGGRLGLTDLPLRPRAFRRLGWRSHEKPYPA